MKNEKICNLEKQINTFPKLPGVYIFKNKCNEILYIGKAKNLFSRVKSYFKTKNTSVKVKALLQESELIEYRIEKTELAALLLEASLIQLYEPKYNVLLKDGQPFLYLVITEDKEKVLPTLIIERNKKKQGDYFGPFLEKISTRKLYNFLIKTFRLKICGKKIKNGCLEYHLGICAGSCIDGFDKKSYLDRLFFVKKLLSSNRKNFLSYIKLEIEKNNKNLDFEKSKKLVDFIELSHTFFDILEDKNNYFDKTESKDIWIFLEDKALFVFTEKRNVLKNSFIFYFDILKGLQINDDFTLYIRRYYSRKKPPAIIITNKILGSEEKILTEDFLQKWHKNKDKTEIIVPKQGNLNNLLSLGIAEAKQIYENKKFLSRSIKQTLKLVKEPKIIDCFDISHKQGLFIVGSCIRFENGEPVPGKFRKFKIKTVNYSNDYACLQEVVLRRYRNEDFPDLIVIDGGKGQLSSVQKIVTCNVEIVSLAKKEETIFSKNIPQGKKLDQKTYAAQVLMSLRDYAHHFAISYHRRISIYKKE